uniref:Uncharacterized protein n=1 Tax=Arundo donax TaxID=35708 RepID=A0A0A9FJ09_ARUDO
MCHGNSIIFVIAMCLPLQSMCLPLILI